MARGTTIADSVLASIEQYKLKTDADLDLDRDVQGLASAELSDRTNNVLLDSYRSMASALVRGVVRADSAIDRLSLRESIEYLIEQMKADAYYVTPPTVSVSVTPYMVNSTSDLTVYSTIVDQFGLNAQLVYAETLQAEVTQSGSVPLLAFRGETASRSKLAEDWPQGSGIQIPLTPVTVDDSVISNGDFELASIVDTPDSWLVEVGSPGNTVTLTDPTVQTVIISGTPTSGSYFLKYTDPLTSIVHATETLAYNASSSDVQAALREVEGLETVTVSSTGTSPDLTHTITFTGVASQVAILASTEVFDTGSVAHAITTAGEIGSNTGRSLKITGNIAEQSTLYQPIFMETETVYSLSAWFGATSGAAAVDIVLVDGVGGSAILDNQGAAQGLGFAPAGSEARQHKNAFVRVAKNTPMPVYLLVKKNAPTTNDLTIDEIILAPAARAYPGGPYLAISAGATPPAIGDKWNVTVANNYAGDIQKWFDATFDMAGLGLQLPTTGSTLLPDTLIA